PQSRNYTARRTTAARPTSAVPTAKSLTPSGTEGDSEAGVGDGTGTSTGAFAKRWVVVATGARYWTCGVTAPDSSERAKPTGTTNAATIAASNRTRYRFRIARVLSAGGPHSDSLTSAPSAPP